MGGNGDVVRSLYKAFADRDWETWNSLVHPEVTFTDHNPPPDGPASVAGAGELRELTQRWDEVFEGFHAEVEDLVEEGEWVVSTVRWKGRSRDSGLEVEWRGADVAQVEGGVVVRAESGFPDLEAALQDVRARRA